MADVIKDFFEELGGRQPSIPRNVSGTLRFDIDGDGRDEHWLITFDEGSVSAERSNSAADCVVETDSDTLAAIIEGRMNAMAAVLRGVMSIEGRSILIALFRSVLQGSAVETHEPSERLLAGRH